MEEFPEKTPLLLRPLSNRKQSMELIIASFFGKIFDLKSDEIKNHFETLNLRNVPRIFLLIFEKALSNASWTFLLWEICLHLYIPMNTGLFTGQIVCLMIA